MPAKPSATDLAALEEHAGNALRRALDVVREEVLAPRGRGRPVQVRQEGIRFAGRPAHDSVTAAVEEALQRGLVHALAASEIDGWYQPGEPAALSAAPVGEGIDPDRAGRSSYRIPSYGGAPEAVVTLGEPTFAEPLTVEAVLEEAWQAHKARFSGQWDPAAYGYPGYYGSFLVDGTWMENKLVYFAHVDAIDEHQNPTTFRWQLGGFDMFSLPPGSEEEPPRRGSLAPALDHYVLTRTDNLATEEVIVQLMEAVAAEDPDYPHDSAAIRRLAAAATMPGWPVHRIEGGRHIGYIVLPPAAEGEGVGHSPIRFIAPGQLTLGAEAGEGQGADGAGRGAGAATGEGGRRQGTDGDGGTGSRRRGGPLGTAEGEGNLWPTLGLGGEPLVCEPFLGEPPVHTLPAGGEELEERMRALASRLELDYCGYAGQFCLNLARLIGARAHAIGVTSATSSVRTEVTVRTDGGGNNGFVDVRPGQASELQYLETLGDIAVQVDRLAGQVRETYHRRENAHLIFWDTDRELDPNPAAWSLRFLIQMHDILERSCMWLYAECCRVILLQQLRSSHEAITNRQARFEETLQRFEEALGILGESVVRLSVLKRALAWARRHDLNGSVRTVLSYAPPPRSMGRGEYYEIPAPIHSVAATILTQLEGATVTEEGDSYVAHYDGKRWTDEDLDTGMAMRRGMLNRVDPMFLQVPDLESVYTRYRNDPGYARTYLTGVLDEMLRANVETTSETADRDDGAFFALEASQYVKAQGGYNDRGLKFDLQGIHALADDVLRPYTDGTDAYRRGINLAIGIKAGWDDFISAFSSVGIVMLGLFCAPLGAGVALLVTSVAGLALTAYDVSEAHRMETLYHSLLDPEAILSWQDVQMQRFMANLSIAFSIFDVVGVAKVARSIVGTMRTGLREIAQQGLRGAARGALVAARRQLLANMAEEVVENALKQAVSEAAVIAAMSQLLPRVIQPVLVPWMRAVAVEHGTLAEVDAVLGPLAAGLPRPTALRAQVAEELLEGSEPGAEAAPEEGRTP